MKGWGSNLFSLQCLAPQTEIFSVDGIEVKGINFKEAVALLRASKTRNIVYAKHDASALASAPSGGDITDKLVTTLRFQDIEADKENSPVNSLSPVVSRDFWTTAKQGKKTRSPLKMRGVHTSPRRRFGGDLANAGKQGDEWVCIPLAEQFTEASSPQSSSIVYEEPTAKEEPPVVEESPSALASVPLTEKVEKVDTVQVSAINTSPYPRVTPLKEQIRDLQTHAEEKQVEVEKLASEVGDLRTNSRGMDGAIALLKFQLSKSRKRHAQVESSGDTVEQSRLITAHLKMSRVLRDLCSQEKAEKEQGREIQTQTERQSRDTGTDPEPEPEAEAEKVDLSSGTLHDSVYEEQEGDLSSGTLCEGGVSTAEACVQCQSPVVVDTSAQCEMDCSMASAKSSVQCDLDVSTELPVPAKGARHEESPGEAAYLAGRVQAQEKFIGLLKLQMHSYVDSHFEVLRQSAEASVQDLSAPQVRVASAAPAPAHSATSQRAPVCEPLQSFPLDHKDEDEGEVEEESVVVESPVPSHSGTVEGGEDVRAAFRMWQATKDTPTDVGLTPRAFKEHLRHIRGSNAMAKQDIAQWREQFAELKEEVDNGSLSYRL